jgi:nucleotide-binding universal stress UspA family protein
MTQPSETAAASFESATHGTVVVGHDGSAEADSALLSALDLATQLKAPVVVLRAWGISSAPRPADWKFGYVSSVDELHQAVMDDLMNDCRPLLERFPGVEVSFQASQGSAAGALIEVSKTARMVVVGARGLGGFAQMLLGSVTDQVVRHAECSVLITRSST